MDLKLDASDPGTSHTSSENISFPSLIALREPVRHRDLPLWGGRTTGFSWDVNLERP